MWAMRYSQLVFIFCVVFLTSGCGLTGVQISASTEGARSGRVPTSDLVLIEIAPTGESPEVFLHAKENAVCRRGQPSALDYGLDADTDATEGDEDTSSDEDSTEESENSDNNTAQDGISSQNKIHYENVGDNWFSIGLNFANLSKYHLVIKQLVFIMKAQWGNQVLTGRKEIGSGYCEGTDPLYIIVPEKRIHFEPYVRSHLGNLILYVDGVPIPTGPPVTEEAGSTATADDNTNTGTGAGARAATARAAAIRAQEAVQQDEYILDRLPSYRVQLIFHGYFINKKRAYVANFKKDIVFHTTSTFLQ